MMLEDSGGSKIFRGPLGSGCTTGALIVLWANKEGGDPGVPKRPISREDTRGGIHK